MPKKKRFDVDSGSQDLAGYLYHDRTTSEPGQLKPALWQSNPGQTAVRFPENTSNTRRFDFGSWYDGRTDAITRACQQVIKAMLEERGVAPVTVLAYCRNGLNSFLGFCRLWSSALDRPMALADIDSALIERFVLDLKGQVLSRGLFHRQFHGILPGRFSSISCTDHTGGIALGGGANGEDGPARVSACTGHRPARRLTWRAFSCLKVPPLCRRCLPVDQPGNRIPTLARTPSPANRVYR